MSDFDKYILEGKWYGHTRYGCPQCPFDSLNLNNFKEHLEQHGIWPALPVEEPLSLTIPESEDE